MIGLPPAQPQSVRKATQLDLTFSSNTGPTDVVLGETTSLLDPAAGVAHLYSFALSSSGLLGYTPPALSLLRLRMH